MGGVSENQPPAVHMSDQFVDRRNLAVLAEALETLERGFERLPGYASVLADVDLRGALLETAGRLADNFPYQHPLYVGQMLKPPHPVAWLAYALAMALNPNNHSLDGGRASSAMEKEAVAQIASMFGCKEVLGHLCGGGTLANFEALWIARELNPGLAIAASAQAHFTHARLSAVLDVPYESLAVDANGCINIQLLEDRLARGGIGTVVATLGTTAAGRMDPLPEIVALRERYGFRLHVDTAYGGYFTLAQHLDSRARAAFECIQEADSIVVDPHKHGLQPYGCGCVLFRDPGVGRFYRHDSPYTYFSSTDLHLGEISLECSRAGASAVALWTTMKVLPLIRDGAFARSLDDCLAAARELYQGLDHDPRFTPLAEPQLDILVWAVNAPSASAASQRAQAIFSRAAQQDLHLALATFPRAMCTRVAAIKEWDREDLTCLRACTMKPEHLQWMPELLKRLDLAAGAQG